ncbi:MAG: hypothetical protein Q7S89_02910 [bacterium]|nr:hypothetical protein [bacterium]
MLPWKDTTKDDDHGKKLSEWKFKQNSALRGVWWYCATALIATAFLIYAIVAENFLFAVIIVLFVGITALTMWKGRASMRCVMWEDGIQVAGSFYPYDRLVSFWIVYEPDGIQAIFCTPKRNLSAHITIPLGDQDPIVVRKLLLKHLEEDLDREYAPLSEQIARLLKL